MARRSVTRQQVSGYRFLTRRMEYALACRDTRMLDDPIRGQSLALTAGVAIAAIVVAVCAVLALLRPHGTLGADPIMLVRESGAVYVRVGDTMHPALNLASARLITGSAAAPQLVSAQMIATAKRGPLMGIPGAPATIAPALPREEQAWTVCDDDGTTLTIGPRGDQRAAPMVLAAPRGESAANTYLLYDGRRAAVDLRDRAVVRALRLDDVVPLQVSRALLDALPETAPIRPPVIAAGGAPGPAELREFRVGSVLRVHRAAGDVDHYVVLADGVQRIGRVAADLLRFADSQGDEAVPDVSPDRIAGLAVVDTLSVASFPASASTPVGAEFDDVLCARWMWNRTGAAPDTAVLTAKPHAGKPDSVNLVQADGAGPQIDAVAIPAGRSVYVRATGIAGEGRAGGPRYLIDDGGVAFGVGDDEAAGHLGLPSIPGNAPWPILALLPRGPELSVARASVVRDGVAPVS